MNDNNTSSKTPIIQTVESDTDAKEKKKTTPTTKIKENIAASSKTDNNDIIRSADQKTAAQSLLSIHKNMESADQKAAAQNIGNNEKSTKPRITIHMP